MSELYLRDEPESDGLGVLFCSDTSLDDQSKQHDAIVEMVGWSDDEGQKPMCEWGYNWNLEEAKRIRAFLDVAISNAEQSND